MIRGTTKIIAHLGFPTESFKAPMIYNPYFEDRGIDAVVVPMGARAEDFPAILKIVFRLANIAGALITMPHKVTTMALLDAVSTTAKIAGSCNAVRLNAEGKLIGDMFDGEGFVRGVRRKGKRLEGARAYVLGCGGVGSAIAASLAQAGVSALGLKDPYSASAEGLAARIQSHYPDMDIVTGVDTPSGYDLVVNASPIGMKDSDPLPMDVSHIARTAFVGEVVMKQEYTPFLKAAMDKGCAIQVGTDMLFEQIPAYLEFFGFPTTTPDELRRLSKISY